MNEGEVSGCHSIECPYCGLNNWEVRAENYFDGPHVNLNCATEDCDGSVLISISQEMMLY